MKYTPKMFGNDLKTKLSKKEGIKNIADWAYNVFLERCNEFDNNFNDLLITLGGMELGPEFEFSYEELNKLADDLIEGKNINPDLKNYTSQ